jgi:hypothetical protein
MVIPLMMLAIESGGVVTPRMMKLMPCDAETPREVHLMFSEKLDAAFETASSLMAGASGHDIVHRYRQHVAANAKRLGRDKFSERV